MSRGGSKSATGYTRDEYEKDKVWYDKTIRKVTSFQNKLLSFPPLPDPFANHRAALTSLAVSIRHKRKLKLSQQLSFEKALTVVSDIVKSVFSRPTIRGFWSATSSKDAHILEELTGVNYERLLEVVKPCLPEGVRSKSPPKKLQSEYTQYLQKNTASLIEKFAEFELVQIFQARAGKPQSVSSTSAAKEKKRRIKKKTVPPAAGKSKSASASPAAVFKKQKHNADNPQRFPVSKSLPSAPDLGNPFAVFSSISFSKQEKPSGGVEMTSFARRDFEMQPLTHSQSPSSEKEWVIIPRL